MLPALVLFAAATLWAQQPKRILFLSHSAGFRHDSIAAARESLATLAPDRFEITATEDLSYITADRLRDFQAVFFFTSGELALDAQQKSDLLAFVRQGGGFAGAHSTTDTLYTWPEYGELIGGYFDGHPWVGQTDIEIEDPDHPATRGFNGRPFRILDEIYKFREFSRDRVRVLMTLRSSIGEPGVNKPEYPLDSPLAWCRNYGAGRVFYTALGHFDETWKDERIRTMFLLVLGWLTGEEEGDGAARTSTATTRIARIVEPAQESSENSVAPGAVASIVGENLTTGSTMTAEDPALRLAGTWVSLDNLSVRILSASPGRIDFILPANTPTEGSAKLTVTVGTPANAASATIGFAPSVPGIYSVKVQTAQIEIQAGGLADSNPTVSINGERLQVIAVFATRKPGVVEFIYPRPAGLQAGVHILMLESGGKTASFSFHLD